MKVGDEKFGDIVLYDDDEMCDFIEEQAQNEDGTLRIRKIIGHRTSGNARKTHKVHILNGNLMNAHMNQSLPSTRTTSTFLLSMLE